VNDPRAASAPAPTVRRVVLGRRLQTLRERAGLSYEQAAQALDVTHATIRRMEKAEVGLKVLYVEKLLRTYGVTEQDEVEQFIALTRRANEQGWWHRYRDVLQEWFSAYVSLEEAATLIRAYEPHYVPGLLQTEEYARTVLRAGRPHATQAEVDRLVALRTERQALITRPDAPTLWVVLDETVLRRPVGPPHVVDAQLAHLIDLTALPNVIVQIMPFSAGPHPAMYGPFYIFRFESPELPDVVYCESLTGAVYLDDREDVSAHAEALDRMCAQSAPVERTVDFLGAIRKELK
jgi:transcriptional regulator with XRE-family HTH domain